MPSFGMPGPTGPWREYKAVKDTRDQDSGPGHHPYKEVSLWTVQKWMVAILAFLFLLGTCKGG